MIGQDAFIEDMYQQWSVSLESGQMRLSNNVRVSRNVRPYRERDFSAKRHFIYRNLNDACWSVRAVDGRFAGLVVAHADSIALYDAEFRVNLRGRDRVLATRRKNVHAGVTGILAPDHDWLPMADEYLDTETRYDPYKCGVFTAGDTFWPVRWATHVHFGTDGKVRAGGCR